MPTHLAANNFRMGVSAALPDAQSAQQNPALAGELPSTEISATPSISLQNQLLIRYQDSGTIERNLSGTSDLLTFLPGFVYKVNPRLGIGISEVAPPINLQQEIKDIPIVILNSTQMIDVQADLAVRGALGGLVGYQISDSLSVGAKFNYRSIGIEADVVPSGGGNPLAHQSMDMTSTTLLAGVTLEPIPEKLRIGLATTIFSSVTSRTAVESAFVAQQQNGGGNGESTTNTAGTFSQFIVGAAAMFGPRQFIAADLDYKAADPDAAEFSMVEFKEKPSDVYNRLDFRATGEFPISRTASLVGGFALENASKGPGSRSSGNDPGKAGFGSADVITIYTGQSQLVPAQSFMGGVRMYFLNQQRSEPRKEREGNRDKDRERDRVRDREPDREKDRDRKGKATGWIVGVGLAYRTASLGVDENGELPGAYSQTKIYLPLEITRRF
ncbi:MAG: hypothetical protein RIQ81_2546 [Pseudomonadota bacterium]|jgi:hypothetical protein